MKHIFLIIGLWFGAIFLLEQVRRSEPIVVLGAIGITLVILVHMFHQMRMETREAPRSLRIPDEQLGQLTERLDAIALEVERVGEGQRFLTKLAAERDVSLPRLPAPPSGNVRAPGN
jgi:hypothetical protein